MLSRVAASTRLATRVINSTGVRRVPVVGCSRVGLQGRVLYTTPSPSSSSSYSLFSTSTTSSSSSGRTRGFRSLKWPLGIAFGLTLGYKLMVSHESNAQEVSSVPPSEPVITSTSEPQQQQQQHQEIKPEQTTSSSQSTAQPETEKAPPEQFDIVLIGGGAATFSALHVIRELNPDAKILLVAAESELPYMRSPLSKELWAADSTIDTLDYTSFDGNRETAYFESEDWFKAFPNMTIRTSTSALDIDPSLKLILLSSEEIIAYDKCLIASGSHPKPLGVPVPEHLRDDVTPFHNVSDLRVLKHTLHTKRSQNPNNPISVAIVGGTVLASELAASISQNATNLGVKVVQISPDEQLLGLLLPPYLSQYLSEKHRSAGVDLKSGAQVVGLEKHGNQVVLNLSDQSNVTVDHVVIATGVAPNAELGDYSMEIDRNNGGIVVNAELQARTDVYVAGDVASFYDITAGSRKQLCYYDHAIASGRLAALNMLSETKKAYTHQPMFWFDIGEAHAQGVGVIDSRLRTVGVWIRPDERTEGEMSALFSAAFETEQQDDVSQQDNGNIDTSLSFSQYDRGIVYYLRPNDNQVVGVLFWNVEERIDEKLRTARRILTQKRKFQKDTTLVTQITIE